LFVFCTRTWVHRKGFWISGGYILAQGMFSI
jgi:hypothetical protein